ncbi:MAG: hypothetical protein C0502_07255 [Opitutus sp.]|nr:hypothetical protein [Opitutus sp.]
MKSVLRFLVPCLFLLAAASAATVEMNLPVKELKLPDGRVLSQAAIKSYNTVTEVATVLVGRDYFSVRLADLPAEVQAGIRERVPLTADEIADEKKQARESRRRKAARAEQAAERREDERAEEAREIRRDTRRQAGEDKARQEAKEERIMQEVMDAAHAALRRKFRYEENAGTGSSYVLSDDYSLNDPEEVSGWSGRYRVTGKAYVREYDSRGGFNSRRRDVEILIQTKEKKRPEVLEVLVK